MSSETSPSILIRWVHHRGYPIEFNHTGSEETFQRILKDEQRFTKTTREASTQTSRKSAKSHTAITSTETPTSILLNELRQHPIELRHEGSEETMKRILEHNSKFPKIIREAITEAASLPVSNPKTFYAYVLKELKSMILCCRPENMNLNNRHDPSFLWKGLDCDVDTEDELEVAIRFFPSVLCARRDIGVSSGWKGYDHRRKGYDYIYWVTLSLKTIQFVPLIIGLHRELSLTRHYWYHVGLVWHELITNEEMRTIDPEARHHTDPDFDRQLRDTCISVLARLKKDGHCRDHQEYQIAEIMMDPSKRPRHIVEKLRFATNCEPSILSVCLEYPERPLLVDCFYEFLWCNIRNFIVNVDDVLIRFHTVFELGMLHYPRCMGFLFHQFSYGNGLWSDENKIGYKIRKEVETQIIDRYTTPFCEALGFVGEDKIIRMVDKVLAKHGLGQPVVLLAWISEAAANKQMEVDGLYFLLRRYAIGWFTASNSEPVCKK